MIVAIFPNLQKPQAYELAVQIRDFFASKKTLVVGTDEHAKRLNIASFSEIQPSDITIVITIGGDGSILSFIHSYPEIEAPIMGINLGSLGFLADIPVSDLAITLEAIVEGSFSVQERLMLEGHSKEGVIGFGLNEIAVHRGKNHTLVDLSVFVNGKHLNTFSADGVIVATPSGSTAYSLSAGGPIISPLLEACVITPICPHTITNRPIVLRPDNEIIIQYLNNYEPVEVIFDGIYKYALHPAQSFAISPAKKRFRLAVLKNIDYFAILRTKLGWSGTLKI
jgi:NAD+ kinase